MTKDEALKMAIEVLWSVEEYDETGVNIAKKAINACKEALEPEPMTTTDVITCKMVGKCCMTGEALEQLLTRDWKHTIDERIARDSEFKEALEQPAQEPVEYLGALANVDGSVNLYFKKDQWRGLTDDEILDLEQKYTDLLVGGGTMFHFEEFARAIEQALKDKNT
jgi:hypothetical protein